MNMRNSTLLLASVLSLFMSCSVDLFSGGTGEETTNGYVSGIIRDSQGSVSPNVRVLCVSSHYNPVSQTGNLFADTTENTGRFNFTLSAKDTGIYTIQAAHLTRGTKLLIPGIVFNSQQDTIILPPATLKATGVIKAYLPNTVDTVDGYIYIEGTTYSKRLSLGVISNQNTFIAYLDSIPEISISGIHYGKVNDPSQPVLISDTIPVIPNDTVVTEAYVFWANYTSSNSPLPGIRIQDIFIDTDGSYWLTTLHDGVAHFTGTDWTVYTTGNSSIPGTPLSQVFRDIDRSLWIVTQGGIAILTGNIWSTLTTANSDLPSNELTAFARERSGYKWFSSYNGILYRNGSEWVVFNKANSNLPSDKWVDVIVDSNDHVWCGGLDGVCEYDRTSWKTYTTSNSGIYSGAATALFVDSKKNIWFGHNGGVSKYDGSNWGLYNSSILDTEVNDFCEDNEGNIWIVTTKGVAWYDGTQMIDTTDERRAPLKGEYFHAVETDSKGNMWFGTDDNGVISFGPTIK